MVIYFYCYSISIQNITIVLMVCPLYLQKMISKKKYQFKHYSSCNGVPIVFAEID